VEKQYTVVKHSKYVILQSGLSINLTSFCLRCTMWRRCNMRHQDPVDCNGLLIFFGMRRGSSISNSSGIIFDKFMVTNTLTGIYLREQLRLGDPIFVIKNRTEGVALQLFYFFLHWTALVWLLAATIISTNWELRQSERTG